MPLDSTQPKIPMLWRIRYDMDKNGKHSVFIVKLQSIHAIGRFKRDGEYMIRIHHGDNWIQFSEKNTPDAAALLELWENQCILPEAV